MAEDHEHETQSINFWKSRTGITFLVVLGVSVLLLSWEYGGEIIVGNVLAVLLLVGCLIMHLFMHGSHGGHGGKDDK